MKTILTLLFWLSVIGGYSLYESGEYRNLPVVDQFFTDETGPNCHPNYSGCLLRTASDYDCQGGNGNGPYYTGRVRVYGADPFRLDGDGDGWGCE